MMAVAVSVVADDIITPPPPPAEADPAAVEQSAGPDVDVRQDAVVSVPNAVVVAEDHDVVARDGDVAADEPVAAVEVKAEIVKVNGLDPTTKPVRKTQAKAWAFPGSALKWFGGKAGNQGTLAKWIVSHFVPHQIYAEPYFGGGNVLLARDPDDRRLWVSDTSSTRGVAEFVNDLCGNLTVFFQVLGSADAGELIERLKVISFNERVWDEAKANLEAYPDADPLDIATWLFILNRQSLDGRMQDFAGTMANRTRGGKAENVNSWQTAVRETLPAVHERLLRVVVRNMKALDFILAYDSANTFLYADPPYLHATRTAKDVYAHEMTQQDHVELLKVLKGCKSKVLLSGYGNDMYDGTLTSPTWHRVTKATKVQTGSAKSKGDRVEVLWMNYEPPTRQGGRP
jgi:DNA adenine methylase